jgi:hypothetical protein
MDRFATAANALTKLYNTFYYEYGTAGIDAFAQKDWNNYINFVNPPFSVIGRLINFL